MRERTLSGGEEARAAISTPLGPVEVAASGTGVTRVAFLEGVPHPDSRHVGDAGEAAVHLDAAIVALRDYFADDGGGAPMPRFDLRGTEFQVAVWNSLTAIEPGRTSTYAHVARQIGRPTAIRAVAAAIGANPIGVLIPCHRVIGSDGSLTGYAGGLHRKRWLLSHEGSMLPL